MRILYFSNPPSYSSGYSVQSYHLTKTLLTQGHEVFYIDCSIPVSNQKEIFNVAEVQALYAAQHPEFVLNIVERMDVLGHPKFRFLRYMYSEFPRQLEIKDFNVMIDKFKIDVLAFFLDVWILHSTVEDRFNCPAVCWLPIHFEPVEEATVLACKKFDTIVTLSKDGLKRLPPLLPGIKFFRVPHVIDFKHYNDEDIDRAAVRKQLGVPESAYLIACVMNNSENTERKSFCSNLEAFKRFHDKHPEAILYMHSKLDGAIDVHDIIDYFGIRDHVKTSDQFRMGRCGLTFDFVVNLYKASDVLLSSTCSEGFGIPPLESQSVGCPVIVSNNTAPPDNVYNGEIVDNYQPHFVLMNTSYWWLPDVEKTVEALEKIYQRSPEEKQEKAEYGKKMIRENYNMQTLYDGWKPVMEHMTKLRKKQLASK